MVILISLKICLFNVKRLSNKNRNDIIYNHLTVRLPKEEEGIGDGKDSFLINPFGMLFSEVTASSLIKVDIDGNILDQGSTKCPINKAGNHNTTTQHTTQHNATKTTQRKHSTMQLNKTQQKKTQSNTTQRKHNTTQHNSKNNI